MKVKETMVFKYCFVYIILLNFLVYSEHSTVLKGRGGIPPSQDDDEEVDGAKMIMDLIKSKTHSFLFKISLFNSVELAFPVKHLQITFLF